MSQTTTPSDHPGLLTRVLDWMKAHVGTSPDFAGFSRAELNHMAGDLGITDADLRSLTPGAPDNTVLMEEMMRARGLDPNMVRNSFLALLRDIERVCTLCRDTGICRRELHAGTAAQHAHEFCPNAGTFDDLIDYNMGR